MTKPKVTANSFLKNMGMGENATSLTEDTPSPIVPPAPTLRSPAPVKQPSRAKGSSEPKPGRAGLKHFGGYLDRDTMEQIAILRARLNLDNSALIKQAIEELYNRESAARKFGDR